MRLSLFVLIAGISTGVCAQQPCEQYEKAGTVLKGKLVLRTFFGPPNYGGDPATDSKEHQALLLLDRSLCVDESPDRSEEAEKDQQEVTLVPLGNLNLSPFAGKKVSVVGSLFHANTGHHHTSVLLELQRPPIKER